MIDTYQLQKPINTDADCPVILGGDLEYNDCYSMAKKQKQDEQKAKHDSFMQKAHERIKNIGTDKFKSDSTSVTNTGGYIQLERG